LGQTRKRGPGERGMQGEVGGQIPKGKKDRKSMNGTTRKGRPRGKKAKKWLRKGPDTREKKVKENEPKEGFKKKKLGKS